MNPSARTDDNLPRPTRVRIAALTGAICLCVTAAIAIAALLGGGLDDLHARVLGSVFIAALCTLGGLVGATALGRERVRRRLGLGHATVLLSTVDFGLMMGLIWWAAPFGGSEVPVRALIASIALTLAAAHACLMLDRMRERAVASVRALARLAVGCSSAAALLVGTVAAFAVGHVDGDVWRLLGVLGVLAVLNTLLVPIARRITRAPRAVGGRIGGTSDPGLPRGAN